MADYKDYQATAGRSKTRPYLYSLGKSMGMSQSEIDSLIDYNDKTGEISFGGKNIGKPDTVVDGVSYWSDTSTLDNAFNDYISRSGTVRSKSAAVDQENEDLFKKYNQEIEDLKNTNPFTTEEAKAILAKYDLSGLQARDNEAASGGASNGGNIDSFSAANAMRQQASLINQGQMAVLSAHQQKLDHARSLLSDMGVNIDRVFNQDETSKNNDVARKSEIAAVSGYTPAEWSIQNDAFLKNFVDESGKLKPEYNNTDFQALINNAKAKGDTDLANKYAILRGLKIFGNFDKYGKYLKAGDVSYVKPQRTADYDLTQQQIESAERIAKGENDTTLALADKEAAAALEQIKTGAQYSTPKPTLSAEQAAQAIKNGETSQTVLDAYNYYYGTNYTVDNLPPKTGGPMTDEEVKWWVDDLNKQIEEKYPGKTAITNTGANSYKKGDIDADWIIIKVFESDALTQEQKEYLLYDKFGITEDQVNTAMKDPHYR